MNSSETGSSPEVKPQMSSFSQRIEAVDAADLLEQAREFFPEVIQPVVDALNYEIDHSRVTHRYNLRQWRWRQQAAHVLTTLIPEMQESLNDPNVDAESFKKGLKDISRGF